MLGECIEWITQKNRFLGSLLHQQAVLVEQVGKIRQNFKNVVLKIKQN